MLCKLSDQISSSVVSDSLRHHESQHARPPCPSPTPGVHSDSRPSSQWCHPAISSSVAPFSSCPQSLPASESFPMSQLLEWGGQSTGVSALASLYGKSLIVGDHPLSRWASSYAQFYVSSPLALFYMAFGIQWPNPHPPKKRHHEERQFLWERASTQQMIFSPQEWLHTVGTQ